MKANLVPVLLTIALVGCGRFSKAPVQVDLARSRLPDQTASGERIDIWDSAGSARYAPSQHARITWDDTGLFFRLRGRISSPDDVVSISIRSESTPAVIYLRFPMILLRPGASRKPESISAIRTDPQQGKEFVTLDSEGFRWLRFASSKLMGTYDGSFWVSWEALGYDGVPEQEMLIVVRKVVREAPGAVFAIPAKTTPEDSAAQSPTTQEATTQPGADQ